MILVETIPPDLEAISSPAGVEGTVAALLRLVRGAQRRIDLTAMYWSLEPDPVDQDNIGLSAEELSALGAERGRQLYQGLAEAAQRGVEIRILQSPGFREGPHESDRLAERFPDQVSVRTVDMKPWYGAGIMHQKLWVVDEHRFYLGSANADWRSLAQVKELGVVVEDQPEITADVQSYFDLWWQFGALDEPDSTLVYDPVVGIERRVPRWSSLLPADGRAPWPFEGVRLRSFGGRLDPRVFTHNGTTGSAFVTGSPAELCLPGQTSDLEGLLHTMREAEDEICISVMVYSPIDRYMDDPGGGEATPESEPAPLWWPVFNDALLQAVIGRGVKVRLLVSRRIYTTPDSDHWLRALQQTADALQARDGEHLGRLEIKQFVMPGWDSTLGPERCFPGHSRVNHPKFVVTDRRLNIGTSNLGWSYFSCAAGTSLNTDHPDLVGQARIIFERDWDSPYAQPLMA